MRPSRIIIFHAAKTIKFILNKNKMMPKVFVTRSHHVENNRVIETSQQEVLL